VNKAPDLKATDNIITKAEGAAPDVYNLTVFFGYQNLTNYQSRSIANTHFVMVKIFVGVLKPELKCEMNKKAWFSINDIFRKPQT
jgi:hypothetical protein